MSLSERFKSKIKVSKIFWKHEITTATWWEKKNMKKLIKLDASDKRSDSGTEIKCSKKTH